MYYRRYYGSYRRNYGGYRSMRNVFFHNCKWRKKYRTLRKKYNALDRECRQAALELSW